jgi:hypothetical protein
MKLASTTSLDAFQYLTEKHAAVGPGELETLAKIATKRFVESETPLNETIQKLADERDLNGHQVERVCEMANLFTHQALWPRATEKEKVAFELADAKKLKSKKSNPTPHRSKDVDYLGPPRGLPMEGPPLAALLGVDPSCAHEGLAGPSERQRIVIVLQKKAAEKSRLQNELLYSGMEAETAEKRAYQAVKQEVLGGTPMTALLRAARAAGLGKLACEVLPQFERQLISETHGRVRAGLEKNAISRAPEDLVSGDLGSVTVVNGAHPVMVSLDVLEKKNGIVQNLLHNLLRIDDELTVYGQKLRELT